VRMGHEGRSAGHRRQGGAGSRTRTAGLARSLRPPRRVKKTCSRATRMIGRHEPRRGHAQSTTITLSIILNHAIQLAKLIIPC
jgi:hypothetical protein